MTEHNTSIPIIKAASACVWRGDEVLLIQRGSALGYGRWSLPGGKLEAAETALAAANRELLEETGVTADLSQPVGDYTIALPDVIYVISCFTGAYRGGMAEAGSDAQAVVWSNWRGLDGFALAPNILEAVSRARHLTSV
jgi:8-oxo-dGTP diphosphatase